MRAVKERLTAPSLDPGCALGCRSFAPKGGDVTCVTVYPSDYGLQRMAEEAAMGPKVRCKGGVAGGAVVALQCVVAGSLGCARTNCGRRMRRRAPMCALKGADCVVGGAMMALKCVVVGSLGCARKYRGRRRRRRRWASRCASRGAECVAGRRTGEVVLSHGGMYCHTRSVML